MHQASSPVSCSHFALYGARALLSATAGKQDDRKLCVVQTAPAVRVAIAETMGLAPGEVTAGQMVTGLKQLGFDYVFGERAARMGAPRSRLLRRVPQHAQGACMRARAPAAARFMVSRRARGHQHTAYLDSAPRLPAHTARQTRCSPLT